MTQLDKKQIVLDDISKNYNLIYSKYKPYYCRNYHTVDFDTYNEMITSKIIMPILERLEQDTGRYTIDFYYAMFETNKLKEYILSAVYIKLRFPNRERQHSVQFNGDLYKYDSIEDEADIEKENFKDVVITELYDMLRPERAKTIFGEKNYKYFIDIIHLYLENPDITYKDIELKYTQKSMHYFYYKAWCLIRLELESKGLYTSKK